MSKLTEIFDKNEKYMILGIEKCGTTSLEEDMVKEGFTVARWEWSYCFPNIREFVQKHYPGYKIIIITRDNRIERCYSDYKYALKWKQIPLDTTYKEALVKYPRFAQGSCYEKWIEEGDIVVDMSILTTSTNVNKKSKMTDDDIELTKKAIEKAKNTEYHREYNSAFWYQIGIKRKPVDHILSVMYKIKMKYKRYNISKLTNYAKHRVKRYGVAGKHKGLYELERMKNKHKKEDYSKVLHIWDTAGVASLLSRELRKRGYTSDVIMRGIHDPYGMTKYYGNDTVELDGYPFKMHCKKKAYDYGIIHMHGTYELVGEYKKLFPNKKIVLHFHGTNLINPRDEQELVDNAKLADAIIVATPDLIPHVEKRPELPKPTLCLNAVDTDLFKPMPEIQTITSNAVYVTIRYIDLPVVEKYLKENCPWKYEIFDRDGGKTLGSKDNGTPFYEMPKFYNKYEKLIDVKIYNYSDDKEPAQAWSKTGLEALACGLEVYNHKGEIVKGLPEEFTPEYQCDTMIKVYEDITNSSYNPNKWWSEKGKTYLKNFNYHEGFKEQEKVVIDELSKLKFNSVIEFGCGFGRFTKIINDMFKPSQYEAFDLSIEQVNNAKKISSVDNIKQSTIQTFTPQQKSDMVFGSEVLMHVKPEEVEECIKNIISWSNKYIVIVDVSSTDVPLESHNFIHDYKAIFEKLNCTVKETKVGYQSVFVCVKNE